MFPATNNNEVLFQLLYAPARDRMLFKHNRRYYSELQVGMDVALSGGLRVFPTRDYSAELTAPWRLNPHVQPLRRVSCEQQLDMSVFKRALFPIRLFEEIRVFQACASSHLSVEEIRVFQACTCGNYSVSSMHLWKLKCFKHTLVVGAVTPRQARACPCCALAPGTSAPTSFFFLSCHTVVACLCAHSPPARMLMSSHPHGSSSMKKHHPLSW